MRFVPFSVVLCLSGCLAALSADASESAPDRGAAVDTFRAGIESRPGDLLLLLEDALKTNPRARLDLLAAAAEATKNDPERLARAIYLARREFPGERTPLAETALAAAPERAEVIREAFFADASTMDAALAGIDRAVPPDLVRLPPEARGLDGDIREAIARMTAGIEGKPWPEQPVSDEPPPYKRPDRIRVSESGADVDESSLEDGLFIDREDEEEMTPGFVMIDDAWEPSDRIRLDESKFEDGSGEIENARPGESPDEGDDPDSDVSGDRGGGPGGDEDRSERTAQRRAREAGIRERAPAGAMASSPPPKLPGFAPSRNFPEGPEYRSTIDRVERRRPFTSPAVPQSGSQEEAAPVAQPVPAEHPAREANSSDGRDAVSPQDADAPSGGGD